MSWISHICHDIVHLKNVTLYLIIAIAFVEIATELLKITLPISIESLILVTLALLATAMVDNIHKIDKLIEDNLAGRTLILAKWFPEKELNVDLGQAKELMIIGLDLSESLEMKFPLVALRPNAVV